MTRLSTLRSVAARIPDGPDGGCVRVAIDGPDGSGKTTFANELAAVLERPVVRISVDDFHQVRAIRYQLGRESPDGFWRHSFNYERLIADVLEPMPRYRPAAHDLSTDEVLDPLWQTAPPGTVLIIDGLFLHREELASYWDMSVFLEVPFEETARRMAIRDGTNPDPEHPTMRRYTEAQRFYFKTCHPQQRATVLIDNADLSAPAIVRVEGES